MSEVTYRDDLDFDVQQAIDLGSTVEWAAGRSLDDMRQALNSSTLVITAWQDRQLIGMARVVSDGVYYGTIWDVIVSPTCRGRGIGREIMQRIINHPKVKRFEFLALFASAGKEGFYERLGFRVHRRGMKLGDYSSFISMEF
jgi:ribosomal protein S18 acetylase RimI-like enzyme